MGPATIVDVVEGEKCSAVFATAQTRGVLASVRTHHGGAHLATALCSGVPNQAGLAIPSRTRVPTWSTAIATPPLRNVTDLLAADALANAVAAMQIETVSLPCVARKLLEALVDCH
jgi:hypothetical protein